MVERLSCLLALKYNCAVQLQYYLCQEAKLKRSFYFNSFSEFGTNKDRSVLENKKEGEIIRGS